MTNQELKYILDEQGDILAQSSDPAMVPACCLLNEKLEYPQCFVTLVGETSSGKSTLINAFLNKKLLVAGARPTTGTVTWIEYIDVPRETFHAIYKDAHYEEIDIQTFRQQTLQPDEKLLRLRVKEPAKRPGYSGLTIFDTPGFNSIVSEHEEVLKEFLPESDFIIFTVSYRVGFSTNDSELMELIAEMDKHFGPIPLLLVVNRTPVGITLQNKRIQEIHSHAQDSLHRSIELLTVASAEPDSEGNSRLPNADRLWQAIRDRAFAPERLKELTTKATIVLDNLLAQRQAEIEGILLKINAQDADDELRLLLDENTEKIRQAQDVVNKYMERIGRQMPQLLNAALDKLKEKICSEIDDAVKWTEKDACTAYISAHAVPFGIKTITRSLEQYVEQQFELMDEEISELANKTLHKINEKAQLTSKPELTALLQNLGTRIGLRLTQQAAGNMLKGMGGCAGMAAGAGNLAKTTVKHIGKIFGKTFGREVYRTIGKVFTQKMLARLNVAVQVLVEVFDYVHEANSWQEKLKESACNTLAKWGTETCQEIHDTMIPDYRSQNIATIQQSFDAISQEIQKSIDDTKQQLNSEHIQKLRMQLDSLMSARSKLKEG